MVYQSLVSVFFLCLCSGKLLAQHDFQPGYVVTNDMDTVRGLMDRANPGTSSIRCFFKATTDAEVVEYGADDLRGYGFDGGRVYVTKEVTPDNKSATYFLEQLVRGTLNLYYLRRSIGDLYFIEDKSGIQALRNEKITRTIDGKMYEMESKEYVGLLLKVMADAPSLNDQIQRTPYRMKSLIDLTLEYLSITGDNSETRVYGGDRKKVDDTKWEFKFGVSVGYTWTEYRVQSKLPEGVVSYEDVLYPLYLTLSTNTSGTYHNQVLTPTAFVNVSRNGRASGQLEVSYIKLKQPTIEISEWKIPLVFNYDLAYYKKIRPFVVGAVVNRILSIDLIDQYYYYDRLQGSMELGYYYSPVYEDVPRDALKGQGVRFNFSFGGGFKWMLSERSSLKLEVRRELGPSFSSPYLLPSSTPVGNRVQSACTLVMCSYVF